jgi:hypothetical protein
VVRRPDLWRVALRQAWRLAPARWWRRPPFLPLPDHDYVRFRLETMYGRGHRAAGRDLVTWLEWCRDIEPLLPDRHRGQQLP